MHGGRTAGPWKHSGGQMNPGGGGGRVIGVVTVEDLDMRQRTRAGGVGGGDK